MRVPARPDAADHDRGIRPENAASHRPPADWWNVSSTGIADYRLLAQEFERACAEVGRDPATVRRTWSGGCVCAPTEAEVTSLAAAHARRKGSLADEDELDFDFVGTPGRIIEQMEPFIALGVEYFMLDCGGFPDLTTVETMIGEVLPQLNR
jgi:alkanesulfonate monooxygenase SsuD/methylene tetrahydromethanopterin reductase-like flavin-dependent oxidoreductase (luciferase family)